MRKTITVWFLFLLVASRLQAADLTMEVDTALTVPVNIFPLIDDTDFKTREDSVTDSASGMDLTWNFVTTDGTVSTISVSPTGSGDYEWDTAGDGMYTIAIPASGSGPVNNDEAGIGWFTGACDGVLPWRGPTVAFVPSAIANADVDGTAPRNVNVTQITGDAQSATDLKNFADNGYDPITAKIAGVVLTDTTTTITNRVTANVDQVEGADATDVLGVPQTGDAFARLGMPSGGSMSNDIANLLVAISDLANKTDKVEWVSSVASVGYQQGYITLASGPAEDDALNGMIAIITGPNDISKIKAVKVSDYGASGHFVVFEQAFNDYTIGVNDQILFCNSALAPTYLKALAAILGDTGTDGVVVASGSKAGYSLASSQTFNNMGTWTGDISGSVGSIGTDGITAASIADDAIDAGAIAAGAIVNGTEATGWNDLNTTQINAEVAAALADVNLDHLMKNALAGGEITSNSAIAKLAASDGNWASFVNSDDSLQAQRDHIDTIFDGAPTFAEAMDDQGYTTQRAEKIDKLAPALLLSTAIDGSTVAVTQTSFVLAGGPPDDDALNGALVVITNSIDASQKSVGLVKDYNGTTKELTLLTDPGVFTFADGDQVDVIATGSPAALWLGGSP
jgi:hypothetical protein